MPVRIGKYSGLELIGKGATASVYLAQHPDLRQQRAIKVFEAGRTPGPDGLLPEAIHQACLRHRHIMEVYDQDIDAQTGRLYLVMEYAPGGSLRGLLDKGPLDGHEALGIATQIAQGLTAAHAEGICHLDIKPENIMLRESGDAAIGDFGLAVHQNHDQGGHPGGTPNYMAPEQIQGACGPACDVWALGAVLYEMLAGSLCFQGEERDTIVQAVLSGPGDIAARLRRVGCAGPPGVANLLHRMMEADPTARLSAADAARELAAMAERAEERVAVVESGSGIPTEAGQWQCKNCGQATPWGMDLCLDCVDKSLPNGMLVNEKSNKRGLWISLTVAACAVLTVAALVFGGTMRWQEDMDAPPAIALIEQNTALLKSVEAPSAAVEPNAPKPSPEIKAALPKPVPEPKPKTSPAPKAAAPAKSKQAKAPVTKRAVATKPIRTMRPKAKAIEPSPNSGTLIKAMAGSGAKAEILLRGKLRAQPGHTGALRNLALLLMEQKRYHEALAVLAKIARRNPGDAEARQAVAITRRLLASGNL